MASVAAPAGAAPVAAPPADEPWLRTGNYPLLVLGVMLATIMQVLDITIANVAIPHMQSALGASPDNVTWILTSYIIASAVAMPITGWLADRLGARRLFIGAVAMFILASMACGVAQNLEQMVLFRALQGVAAAFIAPLSQSTLIDTTRPSMHAQIIAIWGMGVVLGPIVGPVFGGWLTETASWRWVFYVNLPIGLISLAILITQLPKRPLADRRFDLFGFLMIGLSLGSLQMLLDRGNMLDWYASPEIWIWTGLCLSAAWIAVVHLATGKDPLFPRQLFTDPNFTVALVFMVVVGALMVGTMALLPPMLQQLYRYDVIDTGLVLAPRGVGVICSMMITNQLRKYGFDTRWMMAIGFIMAAWTMHMMTGWNLEIDATFFATTGFMQGLGIGLVFLPINTTAFAFLPPQLRTDGSSLLNLGRSIGGSVGISLVVTVLARSMQVNHEELAARITPEMTTTVDISTLDRFQDMGATGLAMADGLVTREAAMIAYLNDFAMMQWVCLAAVPLVLLIRRNVEKPTA